MRNPKPLVLLVQLPISPPGPQPVRGNVPLAAGYLKLMARKQGLEDAFAIEILPSGLTNVLGDRGLVEAILAREPWMVGFTCYVWNIERTLWIADRLKEVRPDLKIIVGGPEITGDNAWVLNRPSVDYAAIGEGEQTFVELLDALRVDSIPRKPIDGLAVLPGSAMPRFRVPLARLDEISSPYLDGILDASEEQLLLLETVRGCRFRCKFCYYPKSYDALYFLSPEKIEANLRHAAERGAREVVLLDPTLNQRTDFADFLRLLARHNPDRRFTYSAELRAEGVTGETASLLQQANFTEVEVGLQSLDSKAQELMHRKVNLAAFERGVKAMLDAGIHVRTDLILGLPGDTPASIRRGIDYLVETHLFSDIQVFQLSILPGTAFRHEAEQLGLVYQSRPPYYVLGTPTLSLEQLYDLMDEAQDAFGIEFDPFPPPALEWETGVDGVVSLLRIDLDESPPRLPSAEQWAHVLTLWFRSRDLDRHASEAARWVEHALSANPHATLQIVLEPLGKQRRVSLNTLETLRAACYTTTSYLDLYYSLHPNPRLGAKRLIVLLPAGDRAHVGPAWIEQAGEFASLAWWGGAIAEDDLELHEHLVNLKGY